MSTASEEFTKDEKQILASIEATPKEEAQEATAEAQQPASQETADAHKPDVPQTEQSREAAMQHALRASRRAENRASKELASARAEIEALKSGKATTNTEMSDAELAELEEDFPVAAKMAKRIKELEQIAFANKPAQSAEFEPIVYQNDVQTDIDAVPLLFELQHDPARQDAFQKAIELDTQLAQQPEWANKPRRERFAEVAKQFASPIQQARQNTKAIIDALPVTQAPVRIGDLRGGASPNQTDGNVDFYGMSEQQILSHLRSTAY